MGRPRSANQARPGTPVNELLYRVSDGSGAPIFELTGSDHALCVERRQMVGRKREFSCYATFESEGAFNQWCERDSTKLTHPHAYQQLRRAGADFFRRLHDQQAVQGE